MLNFRDSTDVDLRGSPSKTKVAVDVQATSLEVDADEPGGKAALPNWEGPESSATAKITALRRPVNYRFLVAIVVVCVLSAGGLYLLHEHQMRESASSLRARARQAQAEGELDRAAHHLAGYLDFAPHDVDAREELALLLNESATTPRQKLNALLAMERVLRDDGERNHVRRELVDVALAFGRYHDAIMHLEMLLAESPADADLQFKLGEVCQSAGQWPEAAAAFQMVIRAAPRRIDAYERLAEVLHKRLDQPEEADRVIGRMMTVNEGAYGAHAARARYHRRHGLLKRALIDARTAFQLASAEPDVLLLLADLVVFQPDDVDPAIYFDPQTVRDELEQAMERFPNDARLPRALAQLELARGRVDLAEQQLRSARRLHPDDLDHIAVLADVLISRGNVRDARRELFELKRALVPAATLNYLEGRLAAAEGDWLQAARKLERVQTVPLSPDFRRQLDLTLADCYRELGLSQRRVEMLRQAVGNQGFSHDARRELARALVETGQFEEAVAAYRQLPAAPETALAEASVRLLLNQRLPESERSWTEIEQLLDRASADADLLHRVMLLRASSLTAQGEPERALALLERAGQRQPGRLEIWLARAELTEQLDQLDAAAELLASAESRFPRNPRLFRAKVRHFARISHGEPHAELIQMADRWPDFPVDEQPRLLVALANAFSSLREKERSQSLWARLAELRPNDAQVWLGILDFAGDVGSVDDVRNAAKQIRRIEGVDGPFSRMAQAVALVTRARSGESVDLEQARKLLIEADTQLPASGRLPLLLADLELMVGNIDAAADYCLQAIERGRIQQSLIQRAFLLLYQQRRFAEAHELVERFRGGALQTSSNSFGKLITDAALRAREFERAVDLARRTVAEGANELIDRLWLAQVLWTAGRVQEAEQQFRETLSAHRNRAEPWIALVHFLARNEQREQALEALDDAAQALPDEQRDLTLGRGYELVGQPEVAARHYQRAFERASDDPAVLLAVAEHHLRRLQPENAEPLFRRLLSKSFEAPATSRQRRLARRALATMLIVRPGYSAFSEALQLLDGNLAERSETADLRLKARLLAARRSRTERTKAVAVLERLRERGVNSRSDQLLLLRLYLSLGNWPHGRDALLSLLYGYGQTPQHLALGVREMLDHGESTPLVEQWLEQLENVEPDTLRSTELRSRLLIGRGKIDEALAVLDGACDDDDASACRRRLADVLNVEALRLEFQGEAVAAEALFARAETLLRDQLNEEPMQLIQLIMFLAGRMRVDEAFRLLDTAWETCDPQQTAEVSVRLLQTGRVSGEQSIAVWNQLQTARAAHPQAHKLVFHMANAAHIRQDYETAVRLYREAIRSNPRAVVAYNELALLLALTGSDLEESLVLINHAIETAGPLAEFLDTRAMICLRLDRPSEALDDLQRALADEPTAGKYFHLAQAHAAQQEMAAAKAAFQRGVALGLQENVPHPLERQSFAALAERLERFKFDRTHATVDEQAE